MTENAALITTLLSLATLVADVLLIAVLGGMLLGKYPQDYLPAPLVRPVLLSGALIASAAIALSLWYSEIVGFEPCTLCWWQRIFIYPQAVLFFIAWRRADYGVWRYTLPLSVFGLFFAGAHWLLQTFDVSLLPCAADGPDCSKIYFQEFGYVTFPVMAITTLLMLLAVSLVARREERRG
ncbi:MAG TPA: disulfide bond formation protein B [Candidatus Paceibacterota bacterium]|nr:disulfide bond formation protein B [Candidatus Paceibacterota bacterium]